MEIIKAEEIPKIAVDSMNDTHWEEVSMVNELGALIHNMQARCAAGEDCQPAMAAAITSKLKAWHRHTKEHFERENQLMQEHGFPAFAVHSQAHQTALERLEQVVHEWEENRKLEALHDYCFKVWPDWFLQHVQTMDFVTARFLQMRMK